MESHNTTLVSSLGLLIGPACEAGLSAGMRRERVCSSLSEMSKVRSTRESLMADCSIYVLQPPERCDRQGQPDESICYDSVVVSAERRYRRSLMSSARCQTGTPVMCHAYNGTPEYTTRTGFFLRRVTGEASVTVELCVLTYGTSREVERLHSAQTAVGHAGMQRYPQGLSYTDPTL